MNEQSATTIPITRKYIHSFALNSSPVFGALLPVLPPPPAAAPVPAAPVPGAPAPAAAEELLLRLLEVPDDLFEELELDELLELEL